MSNIVLHKACMCSRSPSTCNILGHIACENEDKKPWLANICSHILYLSVLRTWQSKEHSIHSNISRRIETSSLLPSKAPVDNGITRTRQIVATTGAQVPLETSSHIFERRSGQVPERKSVNHEVS